MNKKVLFLLIFILTNVSRVFATDYYISNAGNDAAPGTSPAHAWRTTARVNATQLQPGDRVLLAGGQSFEGGLEAHTAGTGAGAQPIIFRSYGVGRAIIQSGDSFGFYAHNTAGIELRQLAFVGSGRLSNTNSGIIFYLDSANTQLYHLRFDSLAISGYHKDGLSIGSWNGLSGYTDVRITNCQVHDNGVAGISSYAFYPSSAFAHHDWYVANCTAYNNSGRTDILNTHTGNGIMLSGIDGALIEKCTAYHNGWMNANPAGGPVGIWGYCCNNLVIQHCESHHNMSGTTKDGGGFDIDGGCTNSIMQYNYSHDNQGAGFLLCQFEGAPAMYNLTVRYNISENDARNFDHGAVEIWSAGSSGGIVNADIYNNTVYLGKPASGSASRAVFIASAGVQGITLRNNIIQTDPGLAALTVVSATGVRLEGNCYWTPSAAILLDWAGTPYHDLATWRTATGQEMRSADAQPTGLCADPLLPAVSATNGAGTTAGGNTPAGYIPGPSSVLVGAGLNLATEFGIDPGRQDFFGNPTPSRSTKGNIGAAETRAVLATVAPASGPAALWCQVYPTVVCKELHILARPAPGIETTVQLFDLLGRECNTWHLTGQPSQDGGFTVPVTGLAAGHYLLRVQNGTRTLRQSVVVAAE